MLAPALLDEDCGVRYLLRDLQCRTLIEAKIDLHSAKPFVPFWTTSSLNKPVFAIYQRSVPVKGSSMNAIQTIPFLDRADAGRRLGTSLKVRQFCDPLVLAIPRGGVVIGFAIAREMNAELDVVLARKLRAPSNPEYAIGAVAEDGRMTINPDARRVIGVVGGDLEMERRYQLGELARRKKLIRAIRPPAQIARRSVIVADDGIATGSTMIAALQAVRAKAPYELIVAVPVAAADRLEEVRRYCDEVVCQLVPKDFAAVGQFYEQFDPVEDEEVVRLLREATKK